MNKKGFKKTFAKCSLLAVIWTFALYLFYIPFCNGHGRLIEPPSRASAWRYGFQTLPDYNDHELYCGGFTRQWKRNEGKCGECGDAWDLPVPRPHEHGGQWGQGVIVRRYNSKSEMMIRVELTASHMGYFEFRICPEPNAKQECFDRHLLKLLGGSPSHPAPNDLETRFYPRNGSRIYEIKAELPDIKCSQCVMQWRYVAGNNWGMCPDGNGAVGCGPQEEFRSCSDIALGDDVRTPMRPLRPTSRTTLRPTTSATSTETTSQDKYSNRSNYVTLLAVGLLVLVLLCICITWYLYRYHGQKIKEWVAITLNQFCWRQSKKSSQATSGNELVNANTKGVSLCLPNNIEKTVQENDFTLNSPPVPPPRTRRLPRVKEITSNESSIA